MRRALVLIALAACSPPPPVELDATATDADDPADATTDGAIDAMLDAAIDAMLDARPDAAPGGDPFAALRAAPSVCTDDQWCWWRPQPEGNTYSRIFSTAPDNVWLTGGGPPGSVVMQWNGQIWKWHRPPVLPGQVAEQLPMAIGGNGPNNMWLIYGTTVQQWDGATWTIRDQVTTGGNANFNGVWVHPGGTPWVSLANGHVKRWREGSWQTITACGGCYLGSIWGTGEDDIFVTTLPPGILHYDGQFFTQVYSGPKIAAWYQGRRDDVWVSGADNALLHWDGTGWTPFETGLNPQALLQFAGYRGSDDVWWWASNSSTHTGFVHWDGTAITATPVDYASYGESCCPSINSVAIIDDRWWLAGDAGALYTKVGPSTLSPVIEPAFLGTNLWGTAEDDMYFASGGELRHWNGTTMTTLPVVGVGGLTGVAGGGVGGTTELFGNGYRIDFTVHHYISSLHHFDGESWTRTDIAEFPIGGPYRFMQSIHPLGRGEAIAVGQQGMAFHFQNGAWTPIATGVTVDLMDVWGPDPDHLWIVGAQGTFLQWERANPGVFTPDPTFPATTADLHVIHGAGGVTWVATNSSSTVWRRPPSGAWTTVNANAIATNLFAVSADNVVVASSGNARLSRWNGTAFVVEDFGSWHPMSSIFQPPGGRMFLTSGRGILVHP